MVGVVALSGGRIDMRGGYPAAGAHERTAGERVTQPFPPDDGRHQGRPGCAAGFPRPDARVRPGEHRGPGPVHALHARARIRQPRHRNRRAGLLRDPWTRHRRGPPPPPAPWSLPSAPPPPPPPPPPPRPPPPN